MIKSIEIHNFRCFEHLRIESCSRFNVIVGDNAAGKTALLEAIFMALGTSPEISVRFRQQRGLENSFAGPPRRIEEAIWKDLFHGGDWSRSISINVQGDGAEARSLTIYRGPPKVEIPLDPDAGGESRTAPIVFDWLDSEDKHHKAFPRLTSGGLQIEATDEDLPDFFYFSANQTIPAGENAARFSDLSRAGRATAFVELFTQEYRWIDDLNVEVLAGSPVIYATLRDNGRKLPLAYVSGGINRVVGIMLAIASRQQSVVLVDEVEDGIFHKHQPAVWRTLLSLGHTYDGQVFATTHNEEWLQAVRIA
ncbi:MAG: ATP-binding protein [Gammaproteobacteria bacterium]|nr:ATP-binding protein [Gammaproteobacteria bacterium]